MAFLQRDHFEGCTDFASHYERAKQPTERDLDHRLIGFKLEADGSIPNKEARKRAIEWTLHHAQDQDRTIMVTLKTGDLLYDFTGDVVEHHGFIAPTGTIAAILHGQVGDTLVLPYELIVDIEVLTSSEEER